MAAGAFPIPNLSLSDHSAAAGYSTAGGVSDGAFNVSFGSGSAGTAPASSLTRYLPFILMAGAGLWLMRHKLGG